MLNVAHLSEALAFVWAGVLAQAVQIWTTLPRTLWRQNDTSSDAQSSGRWAIAIILCIMSFQIWWCEPWMSQRLLSILCGIYAATMAFGVWGDRDILNYFAPVSKDRKTPLDARRHLLMLCVLVLILVIAINESLLILDTTFTIRVVTLSCLPIVLHYFFEIAFVLTCPDLEDES